MGIWAGEPGLGVARGAPVSRHAGCTLNSIIEMATSPVVFCCMEEMEEGGGEEEREKNVGETFLAVPVGCVVSLRDRRLFQESGTVTYPSVSRRCSSRKMDVRDLCLT